MAEVKLLGVQQAVTNLKTMADAIQLRITRKAVRGATQLIAKAVKTSTYGGGRDQRTGLLKQSQAISVSTKRAGLVTGKIVMRPIDISGSTLLAQRVRNLRKARKPHPTKMAAFYWRFLERGTKPRATRGGANRGHVPAMPWVEPGFDAHASAALDLFSKIFNRETEDEARKLNTRRPAS